jgi:antitoxin HigA-1
MVMQETVKSSTTAGAQGLLPIPAVREIALTLFIGVLPRRINEIVLGKRAVTADTDLRLTRYFKLSGGFFLRLQMSYDLRVQRRLLGDKLDFIKQRAA